MFDGVRIDDWTGSALLFWWVGRGGYGSGGLKAVLQVLVHLEVGEQGHVQGRVVEVCCIETSGCNPFSHVVLIEGQVIARVTERRSVG